jgi:uncharacterized protein YkwD
MNSRRKILIGALVVLAVAALSGAFLWSPIRTKIDAATADIIASRNDLVGTILNSLEGDQSLHQSVVIALTNQARKDNGNVPALTENAQLDAGAEAKLNDMFSQQYFDHTSPEGNGPSYIANQAGYSYVVIGENLALGNFKDDATLIAAWMASPGHRANILNPDFVDIGVAVGEGTYQGEKVWMAVQEFGRPLSACPSLSADLKTSIDADRATTDAESASLATAKTSLDSMPRLTSEEEAAYDEKISAYNSMVTQYNDAIASLKSEIAAYNAEVVAFNDCLKE